jgi:hypothetical protein
MSPEATERSFDELARGLASGTLSRGKAIRWMGGALLGAALASFPGVAWANDCGRLGRAGAPTLAGGLRFGVALSAQVGQHG